MNSDPLSQNRSFGAPLICRMAFKDPSTSSAFELSAYFDRHTLSCEHIEYRQSVEPPFIRELVGREIQTPHLIGRLGGDVRGDAAIRDALPLFVARG